MNRETTQKEWLLGKNVDELTQIAMDFGLRRFVGAQLADWIYKKRVTSLDQMTNISVKIRSEIGERYQVGGFTPVDCQESCDGTKKYLYPSIGDQSRGRSGDIEAVYIPDGDRATLCISSQRGCKMGCRFCMTGTMGFSHHLTSGEIVGEIMRLPEFDRLTNVVLMGMGEPLDNWGNVYRALECITSQWGLGWSPTRITLSSIGIRGTLAEFINQTRVHLAISLHNPISHERAQMMPIERAEPISEILGYIRSLDWSGQRRVSFEYIMFSGLNDTDLHLAALVDLLSGLECRVNLIRFHAIPDSPYRGSSQGVIDSFNRRLNLAGVRTTTRGSRGEDIFAACGMLATKDER
ncbi:MAG: 23S rRNA (adenine(2503)-C(2))-methyltransferase RlmN [Rikenellaceae bacterium]